MGEQKWATVSPLYCCDIETGPTTPMIVNMIFLFEWEKGETDDFETHVAFAWLQKRNENVCIVRESNPGRPRGRRAFYHWTNDANLLKSLPAKFKKLIRCFSANTCSSITKFPRGAEMNCRTYLQLWNNLANGKLYIFVYFLCLRYFPSFVLVSVVINEGFLA